jgi:hypothetical protein
VTEAPEDVTVWLLTPVPDVSMIEALVDELHVRRERTRLLAAFDQIPLERRGPRLERRGLVVF